MKFKFQLSVIICGLFIGILATSCITAGLDQDTRNLIQNAINELALQPGRWEAVLSNLERQLGGEMRQTIVTLKREMEDLSREAIEDTGIETRCNLDFIGQRVRDALEQMLVNDQPKYTLLPFICHLRPEDFTVDESGYSSEISIIKVTGFKFTTTNVSQAQIYVVNESGDTIQQITTTPNYVSSYRMTINIQGIQFPTNPRNKLRVLWKNSNADLENLPPESRDYYRDYYTEAAILVALPSEPELPPSYWTRSFSEEDERPTVCDSGFAVKGLRCSGEYCDNIALYCAAYMLPPDDQLRSSPYAGPISEESPNNTYTSDTGFMLGAYCKGKYCDNIWLKISRTTNLQNLGQCRDLPWVSEEQPDGATCEDGSFAAGLTCREDYCDDISLSCCKAGH